MYNMIKQKGTRMRILFILALICVIPLPISAEQSANTSEKHYELIIGTTAYRDIIENFGRPLYTTKTKEGNQVWVYGKTGNEHLNSLLKEKRSLLIEFGKDGKVAHRQIMTIEQILDFKEERGGGPLIGAKQWFGLTQKTKIEVVRGFIKTAKENGSTIRQSPEYYVKEVDLTLSGPHNTEIVPLGAALRVIAVMDGDWDDGSGNKLGIARRLLGSGLLKMMREMEPEKYEKLIDEPK